jgi:hypothetical protein
MPTSAQVSSALRIANTFNILNDSAPINFSNWTDTTDWAALGVSSGAGDTVALIFQTIDPSGQYPYQNAGYQSDVFTSPDATLTDSLSPTYTLFVYAGQSNPIWGTYQIMVKAKVVLASDPSNPIYGYKLFQVELVQGLTPTLKLTETNSCTALTYTSTDATSYGLSNYTLTTIDRVHTVYPPALSGQTEVTANAAIVVLGSPDNPLWNATYEASLSVTLTYTKNGNTFITHAATTAEHAVSCTNDLCALKCCLETLEKGWNKYKGVNTVLAQDYLSKFLLCSSLYTLVQADLLCGGDPASNITAFYAAAAPYCDADCNCGCSDEPGPAQASNILQGPTGPTGPQGPIGATGATGPAGPTGDSGGGILANQFPNLVTTTTSFESLLESRTPFVLAADTLNTDGDTLTGYFQVQSINDTNTDIKSTRMLFNGVEMIVEIDWILLGNGIYSATVWFTITRVDDTTINYSFNINTYGEKASGGNGRGMTSIVALDIVEMTSLDLATTAYDIDVQGKTPQGAGTLKCTAFELIYTHKI